MSKHKSRRESKLFETLPIKITDLTLSESETQNLDEIEKDILRDYFIIGAALSLNFSLQIKFTTKSSHVLHSPRTPVSSLKSSAKSAGKTKTGKSGKARKSLGKFAQKSGKFTKSKMSAETLHYLTFFNAISSGNQLNQNNQFNQFNQIHQMKESKEMKEKDSVLSHKLSDEIIQLLPLLTEEYRIIIVNCSNVSIREKTRKTIVTCKSLVQNELISREEFDEDIHILYCNSLLNEMKEMKQQIEISNQSNANKFVRNEICQFNSQNEKEIFQIGKHVETLLFQKLIQMYDEMKYDFSWGCEIPSFDEMKEKFDFHEIEIENEFDGEIENENETFKQFEKIIQIDEIHETEEMKEIEQKDDIEVVYSSNGNENEISQNGNIENNVNNENGQIDEDDDYLRANNNVIHMRLNGKKMSI